MLKLLVFAFLTYQMPLHGEVELVFDQIAYPESPMQGNDGRLYFVGYGDDRIYRYDGETTRIFWEAPLGEPFTRCGPAGLAETERGSFLLTCYDTNEILLIDKSGETIQAISQTLDGSAIAGPNDLVKGPHEGIYVSASGVFDLNAEKNGRILFFKDGELLSTNIKGLHYANGLAFDGSGNLLVSEHLARSIRIFTSHSDLVFCGDPSYGIDLEFIPGKQDDPLSGPDGLEYTSNGKLLVAEYGRGRVLIFNDGFLEREIEIPAQFVTNMTLIGKKLYVTAEYDANNPDWIYHGALFSVDLD